MPENINGLVIAALLRLSCNARASEVAQYSGLNVDDVEVALRVMEADGLVRATFWKVEL